MKLARQYNNIVSFKDASGKVLGFHSENLDLAELDEDCWKAFENQSGEAFTELKTWDKEINPDTTDIPVSDKFNQFSINIAQVCNLACTYCAADGGTYGAKTPKADLSIVYKQLTKLIGQLDDGDTFSIRFLGGEPLLYPELMKKIADYAKLLAAGRNIQLMFRVTTNGTLITEKVAQILADYKMMVTVSIDGPKEVNDTSRPAKNKKSTTGMIEKSLKTLAPYRDQLSGLNVTTVFGAHNLNILEAYEFFRKFDFDLYNFSYASGENDDEVSAQFITNFKSAIYEIEKKYGYTEVFKINQIRGPVVQIELHFRNRNYCGAGKSLIQTDTQGKLYACNWFMEDKNEIIGDKDIVYEDKVKTYQRDLIKTHNCESCWARNLCGGGCMFYNKQKNGDKHIKDLSFCYRQRALTRLGIEFYYKYNNQINN